MSQHAGHWDQSSLASNADLVKGRKYQPQRASIKSRCNPRNSGGGTRVTAGLGAVVIIVGAVVSGYEGWRLDRYPDYLKLNYSLEDECKIPRV